MDMSIEFFSLLRDCLPQGKGRGSVSMVDGSTLNDLMIDLGIDKRLGQTPNSIIKGNAWVIMVNCRFENNLNRVLKAGDKVQIFPSVAGG